LDAVNRIITVVGIHFFFVCDEVVKFEEV